jgi:hypothetical protein
MKFSITIENATVSTIAKDEYEMLRHIEACFLAAGYNSDTFAEYLAHYLELYHGMVVMLEKAYTEALEEARNAELDIDTEEEEEPALKSEDEYNAGYNDGYNGDPIPENASAAYRAGWYEGNEDAQPDAE